MRIVIHHHKHYDWVPVPKDVVVTEADKAAGLVLPSPNAESGWKMRITCERAEGYTEVMLPEAQIHAYMMRAAIREGGAPTRAQAVAGYLSRHVLGVHTHRLWVTDVEVADNASADTGALEQEVARLTGAGLLAAEEHGDIVKLYTDTSSVQAAVHAALVRGKKAVQ